MENTIVQKQCVLCKMTVDDPVKMGEFKTYKLVSAHYYCLLLTNKLAQNGADNEGILGFLLSDIRVEARRIENQICFYCSQPSANLACCATKCRRMFHLYCGLENFAICHFRDDFKTICEKHHSQERKKCTKKDDCVICCESMGTYNRALSILAPCCRSGWFHKWCIAQFALSAGYFFRCPLCNNEDTFRSKLAHKGIFIPDQDAKWELEPNAFVDLLVRPDSCSAEHCKCPRGRSYKRHPYKLLVCSMCGSKAVHSLCMIKCSDIYSCDTCLECLSSSSPEPLPNRDSSNIVDGATSDNKDEEVDVFRDGFPGGFEECDDTSSIDSLLFSSFRQNVPRENGKSKCESPSDTSRDSVVTYTHRKNRVSEDYISDQDAKWELEPNAFVDLLVRPDSCSGEHCTCPRGRSYKCHPYNLLVCNMCGSKAVHCLCMHIYSCDICLGCFTSSCPEPRDSSNIVDGAASDNKDEEVVDDRIPGGLEECNDPSSMDSLLFSSCRQNVPRENGKSKCASSHLRIEDYENLMCRSVWKRRMSIVYDSTDGLNCSIKRTKRRSFSFDSLFDKLNQTSNDNKENCTVRSKSCDVSRKIKLDTQENHTIPSSDSDSLEITTLRHNRYDDSSSIDSFSGNEMMSTGKSCSSICSSGRATPAYRKNIVGKPIVKLKSVLERDSSGRLSSPDHIIGETAYTPRSGSNSDVFPDSASTICLSSCRQHHMRIETFKDSPISSRPSRSRTRVCSKSICIDRNEKLTLNENVTGSKNDISLFMENTLCDNMLSGSKLSNIVDGKLVKRISRSCSSDSTRLERSRNTASSSIFELSPTANENSENNGSNGSKAVYSVSMRKSADTNSCDKSPWRTEIRQIL